MSEQVGWLFELSVKPGQLQAVEALRDDMVESGRGEAGTLAYDWALGEDRSLLHVYERFADSDAALAHMKTFGETFAGRFMEILDPVRIVVYGDASDEVREGLAALQPVYTTPFGGFSR